MTTESVSVPKVAATKDDAATKSTTPPKTAMPAKGPTPPPPIHQSGGLPAKLPAPKDYHDDPKPKVVGKMEAIEVRVPDLLAALLCTAKDETRFYLQGVYLHRTADGFVRAVATDGTRCLIANLYREHKDKPGPKWLDAGVVVPADGLAQRLKLIAKAHKDELLGAKIAYGENQPRIEISDGFGVNVFRVTPVENKFPKYEAFTTARWTGVGSDRGDWRPTAFKPAYLKAVTDVAKVLGSDSIECFDYAGDGDPKASQQPVLFTFGKEADGVALFLMPIPASQTAQTMSAGNRMLLAPSIKLTLAALKAHETRNIEAAKKATGAEKAAAQAKAEEFARRIKAVLDNTGSGQVQAALPAPKPPKPAKPKKSGFVKFGEKVAANGNAAKPRKPKATPATKSKAKVIKH